MGYGARVDGFRFRVPVQELQGSSAFGIYSGMCDLASLQRVYSRAK